MDTKICIKCNQIKNLDEFYISKANGQRRADCKCCHRKRTKAYRAKPEKKNLLRVAQRKIRQSYALNPLWRMENAARDRVRKLINRVIKNKSFHSKELIGCDSATLKLHLESQFKPGMTWANYGIKGWHIDHIRPCASFDLSKPEEQKVCFHYTNLQPLWAADNLRKGSKFNLK